MTTYSSSTSSNAPSSPPSSQGEEVDLYSPGSTLILTSHVPDPPYGRNYRNSAALRLEGPVQVPFEVTKLEWCLTHPPRPGCTNVQDTRKIMIKDRIRVGKQCGAQVLLTEEGLVAKIYDPFCYCEFNRDWPSETIDVTVKADQDYSNEAAAYSALNATSVQGTIMPRYYGSWTTKVSVDVEGRTRSRDVRLILMEHIAGIQMMDINPCDLTRRARENIMRKVIEADTDLRIAGLKHKDFEPRNIMIVAPSGCTKTGADSSCDDFFEDSGLHVCVIDFAVSCVFDLAGQKRLDTGYHNPLFFWAGADIYCQYGWLPPRKEATDWMWEIWGDGGKHGRYISAERNWGNLLGRPKRPQS